MRSTTEPLVGIGYEGRTIDAFVSELVALGVGTVIDVRLTPLSRKPGFSKRALSEALRSAGIGYRHLAALGNPKWNRAGFADPSTVEGRQAREHYVAALDGADATAALAEVVELNRSQAVALLCFEADERHCHRELLIEHLVGATNS